MLLVSSFLEALQQERAQRNHRVGVDSPKLRRQWAQALLDQVDGTTTNVALKLRQPGRVEVVSGVNLPMVVRLGCGVESEMSLEERAAWISERARASICCGERRNGDHGGA